MIPTNPARSGDPHKDLETAQKAVAEAANRGRVALEKAYGTEFRDSLDMLGAANVIGKLKAERERSRIDLAARQQDAAQFSGQVSRDMANIVADVPLPDDSPLKGVSRKVTRLRDDLLLAQSELAAFKENMRHTMTDRGMAELPGLQGYFSGATPLLAAAEAAAVLTHHKTDNQAKQGYLRKRGWIQRADGWYSQAMGQTRLLEFAVQMQVQADTAPFKILAAPMRNVRGESASAPNRVEEVEI